MKNRRARLTWGLPVPFRQTKKAEIPISKKRVVHTGAKTQLGGLKVGLTKVAYQVGIAGVVKIDPKTPTNWQIIMLIISFRTSFKLIFII
jgi:hypothetical protein